MRVAGKRRYNAPAALDSQQVTRVLCASIYVM